MFHSTKMVLPTTDLVRDIARKCRDDYNTTMLTSKELLVCKVQYLSACGVSDKMIADMYKISEPSVRDYTTGRRFGHIHYSKYDEDVFSRRDCQKEYNEVTPHDLTLKYEVLCKAGILRREYKLNRSQLLDLYKDTVADVHSNSLLNNFTRSSINRLLQPALKDYKRWVRIRGLDRSDECTLTDEEILELRYLHSKGSSQEWLRRFYKLPSLKWYHRIALGTYLPHLDVNLLPVEKRKEITAKFNLKVKEVRKKRGYDHEHTIT